MVIRSYVVLDEVNSTSGMYVLMDNTPIQTISFANGAITVPARPELSAVFDESTEGVIRDMHNWVHEIGKRFALPSLLPHLKFHRELDYKPNTQILKMEFRIDNDKLTLSWNKSTNIVTADVIQASIVMPFQAYVEYLRLWSEFIHYIKEYKKI